MASPTPVPTITFAPTELDTVGQTTQLIVMAFFFVALFSCVACAFCMSAESCGGCQKCLIWTLGCKSCETLCCKKRKKGAIHQADTFIQIFGAIPLFGAKDSALYKFQFQFGLLVWKRYTELTRNKGQTLLYFAMPAVSLVVFKLLYGIFTGFDTFKSSGSIETFAAPLLFIVGVQLTAVSLVTEKSQRLRESMKMMGMKETPYWLSYIFVDAGVMGLLLSFVLTCVAWILKLFWNTGAGNGDHDAYGNFGDLFLLLYLSTFALTCLAFAIASVFDNPQTAGMASFAVLIGSVVLFFVMIFANNDLFDTESKQTLWCLFPPLALQVGILTSFNCGCGLFEFLESRVPISTILSMLILDVFIYSALAWYLAQVMPSDIGVQQPLWFLLLPSYWFPKEEDRTTTDSLDTHLNEDAEDITQSCPTEAPDHSILGNPTVSVKSLRKTFGSFKAVNGITFDMFEGQIFSLLGHNGAGKTTTINMLTGLFSPDWRSGETTIYGNSIKSNMQNARRHLGICPQHDVLFDNLTTREHIIFFAMLKGGAETRAEAEKEADELLEHFHMQERALYVGAELSGGMKRKVSTAIALCGKSDFVVLDEPTAGMDPLARRELWDLLKGQRKGRTMLLTTHYMDEADVLGDRIAIMSRGVLQCMGTSTFLKHQFGAGYKVIANMKTGALVTTHEGQNVATNQSRKALAHHPLVKKIHEFVKKHISGAGFLQMESSAAVLVFSLPFDSVDMFPTFFDALDTHQKEFEIEGYGVTITSLEEVFLRVGGDHDLETQARESSFGSLAIEGSPKNSISAPPSVERRRGVFSKIQPYMLVQIAGLWRKRISYARHDLGRTIPLIFFPVAATLAAFLCNLTGQFGTVGDFPASLATATIMSAGFIPMVAFLSEHVVSERVSRLRNVLTVMGCDLKSYWIGTLLGDLTLFGISALCIVVIAIVCGSVGPQVDDDEYDSNAMIQYMGSGSLIILLALFGIQFCTFTYFCSHWFGSTKFAIAFMPFFIIALLFLPTIFVGLFWYGLGPFGADLIDFGESAIWKNVLNGIAICCPHGALCMGLLQLGGVCDGFSVSGCAVPPFWASCLIMIGESIVFLTGTYRIDRVNFIAITEHEYHPTEAELLDTDEDVMVEREKIMSMTEEQITKPEYSLRIAGLRKIFPAKKLDEPPLQAVKSLSVGLPRGELFGLLGANGAGKTTAINMIMRALYPNAGNVHIEGDSVLSDFRAAARHLGVVTQHNTLWDKLTCIDHLYLFARIRGIPNSQVDELVTSTIEQMELGPYKNKLAKDLSGGMKRKLCVAIALIGDPQVVMLDEPSAGLDPVSRRNLWDTLIKTMARRSVVLTTHSMEEAEALCTRIGIMVKGQMRALGTPQHLKNKFGSGYEIIIKLDPKGGSIDDPARIEKVTTFVQDMFKDATMLSNNGGLLTYRVPPHSIKVGKAFGALEQNKASLQLSDYAVAQPTLEQVFVRTVLEHSEGERPNTYEENVQEETTTPLPPVEDSPRSSLSRRSSEEVVQHPDQSVWVRPSLADLVADTAPSGKPEHAPPPLEFSEDYGLRTHWLTLDRRSHRFLGIASGLFMFACYLTIVVSRIGFVFFCFVVAFFSCMIGCVGCCCIIPANPDDAEDD